MPPTVLPPRGLVADGVWTRYVDRLRAQPVATFTERLRLTGAVAGLPRAFVRCTGGGLAEDPIVPMAARARSAGWAYREVPLPHDPHLVDPAGVAAVLHDLAVAYSA